MDEKCYSNFVQQIYRLLLNSKNWKLTTKQDFNSEWIISIAYLTNEKRLTPMVILKKKIVHLMQYILINLQKHKEQLAYP